MKTSKLMAAMVLSVPLSVVAQTGTYGPTTGAQEFTLSGTGSNDKEFDHGTWGVAASYGRFIDANWQWVIRQSVNYSDTPGDNSGSASTRLGADYNFDFGRWRPFLGLNIGYIYGEAVDNTGIGGPEIGVKYYAKPETFVYLQTEYQFFFEDSDELTDNFDDGAFAHSVGIGFNF